MKVLHTSDWHVGRTLRGRSRADEHRAVLGEIAGIAAERAVDVVLICGDLFDSMAPTPEAESIVYTALLELARTGASVIALSGNHDNPRRLQAVEPLLELGQVTMRPVFLPPEAGGVVDVWSRDGSERGLVAVLPFLSQRHVVRIDDLMDPCSGASEHDQHYDGRVRRLAARLCAPFASDTVNLVAAHLTAAGGRLGGGERAAHTVFSYEVSSHAFPASAHYVALGHLHRCQSIPGACPIRYCGSPLALDFGEVDDTKAVLVVEAHPGQPAEIEAVPLHEGRRLRTVRGSLADLRQQAGTDEKAYLKVVVREVPRVGLADEVRELFPDAVDVVVAAPDTSPAPARPSRQGRTPTELFGAYLDSRGIDDPALGELFGTVLDDTLLDETLLDETLLDETSSEERALAGQAALEGLG